MFSLKVFCFAIFLDAYTALNITRLIGIYMSSCGEQNLCKKWPGMINYEPHPQLQRCPPCSCDESCYRNRNCCPDKFYERKLAELRSPTLFVAYEDEELELPHYELVTTCPISANDDDKLLCASPPLQTYYGPVTSLATNYSYMNEYCAICHGEKEKTKNWSFSTGRKKKLYIFNFIDSMEILVKTIQNLQMTVLYSPPKKLQSIVPDFYIHNFLPTPSCPWDEDLQAACSSSYVHKFKFYRNIFCYICSLSERTSNDSNENLCQSINLTIHNACTRNPFSILTMPFRNIYCIICSHPPVPQFPYREAGNVNPNSQLPLIRYVFEDFSALINEKRKLTREHKRVVLTQFRNITFNIRSLLETIKNINVKYMSERIDDDRLDENFKIHLANVMKITSGIYPWRICDMHALPEIVQNISRKSCDCSFSCLFQAKCTCCIDTAIQHKLQCSSSFKIPLNYESLDITENKFLVVSTCFQNGNRKLSTPFFDEVKYLCEEQPHAFDLPVVKDGVTYRNVFCFICNRNIDIENDISGDEYKIMEFNVICNNQFHFMYKFNLHEIFEGAVEQSCGVVLNTKEVVLCDEYPTNIISTCENKAMQKSLRWACENLSRHSLPPVHQYKNEFCELCNIMEHFQPNETFDVEKKYTTCNKADQMHVQYEKACRSLPNLASHPDIFPHRNIFCLYCTHDDYYIENVPSNFCKPIFGSNVRFPYRLIRNLFFPSMIFDSEVNVRSKEDTEYGCYPGRMYERNECRLAVAFQKNIRYSVHILSVLNVVSASKDSNTVLSEIKDFVLEYFKANSISKGSELKAFYFIPKPPLTISYSRDLYHFNMHVILHIGIGYGNLFDRDKVERQLLRYPQSLSITETGTLDKHYINFDLKGLGFANISETMLSTDMHILPNEHASFIREYKDIAFFDASFSNILVHELLICRHRKIPEKDIHLDFQNYRLIVPDTRDIFYVGEYVLDLNDIVGVCAPFSPPGIGSDSTMTQLLQTLTTVLNIVSTTGLVLLLVIYSLIPSLRTLPGLTIMSSVFSLISMQVTYTVTNTFEKMTFQCVVGGMLLHYFWLCMCCCLFICCWCMWRSFSGPITIKISSNNARTFTYFMLFSYITPLLVVGGNATVVYLLYGDVGYGKKVCFVDKKIPNIVTFVFPLSFICLLNTVLFLHTISKIRFDKNIKKSKQNTSELIIFGKLFSLTGCVWILQIIDGFLPQISTYSFVTTILTSSQGLFIFLSFVTSPQIIKHIKSWKNNEGKTKPVSSTTRCPSTSRDSA